jgi:alkylation response protein AidB-like acyl-CoA dehydrogenase
MGDMTAADLLSRAARVADETLFPAAMDVDGADRIPATHFETLAAAGLYGLAGPADTGGLAADPATFCNVIEIISGGCLATAFVWLQHHSAVRALAASTNTVVRDHWLEPLCGGARRAGIALGGARPGPPLLQAQTVPGGYVLAGSAPWVTGWDMIDVVHTLARTETGDVVSALLPALVSATLRANRLDLVAVNASRTVELVFRGHFVPSELVTGVMPQSEWLARDAAGLRPNGSLSLGVAGRCARLLGELGRSQDQPAASAALVATELAERRDSLDAAAAERGAALAAARAAASVFAFQAAGLLVGAAGSRSILMGEHPQRLAREALFLLVFGSRPAIKADLVALLAGRTTTAVGLRTDGAAN